MYVYYNLGNVTLDRVSKKSSYLYIQLRGCSVSFMNHTIHVRVMHPLWWWIYINTWKIRKITFKRYEMPLRPEQLDIESFVHVISTCDKGDLHQQEHTEYAWSKFRLWWQCHRVLNVFYNIFIQEKSQLVIVFLLYPDSENGITHGQMLDMNTMTLLSMK